jgi:stage V sporulation protein R
VKDIDMARLSEADALIQGIAREMGLDFMPQEFDVVPAQKMLEIMAYHLPVNFSHWSFGRDYESERTRYEHGMGVPYEVVFNSDPCRAYLMDTNPLPIQILVMAHVYAHNDFMKASRHFQGTRRDMITSASEAAARMRRYEEDYGLDEVEEVIDAGLSIQWNIEPGDPYHKETEAETRERLYGWAAAPRQSGPYDDLLQGPKPMAADQKRELRRRTPPEPTVDLLGYVVEHSPRPLVEWEKDVLSVIRQQAQYFMPYRRTKIMNEGWATFWHERIMQRLFREGFLTPEEHGYYNLYNARVKAHHPRSINPYLLGSALFTSIQKRWDMGRFGREYEECVDAQQRASWDTGAMKGLAKVFDVRRTHMDWFFVDEFLDREVVEALQLYLYVEKEGEEHVEAVVEETEWRKVKHLLVHSLMNWGVPRILVVDGDYQGSRRLYLQHVFEGLPLDDEYARRTLQHVYSLWGRPVHLETVELENRHARRKMYTADQDGVHAKLG